jgi:tRNA pseudouridine65 synthase
VAKTYWAIVRGVPSEEFSVDHALTVKVDSIAGGLAKKNKPPQAARTDFRRLASCELNVQVDKYPTSRYALIEAKPHTGRQHQIRRHLKHVSHPIIGDVNYGQGTHNRFFREQFHVNRLLLACTELTFAHPQSKLPVTVKAPLAQDFSAVMKRLGLDGSSVQLEPATEREDLP